MISTSPARRGRYALAFLAVFAFPALADDPAPVESPLIRLLKRAPEGAKPQVIARIGQTGSANDLGVLLREAVKPDALPSAARIKALDALSDAALTRKVTPDGDLGSLSDLIAPKDGKADPALRLRAIRLAGSCKVASMAGTLRDVASSTEVDPATRSSAFEALASLGDPGRSAIESLSARDKPRAIRAAAVTTLATIDPAMAADPAAELIEHADRDQDFVPLMSAFLNRKGAAEILAAKLSGRTIPADHAKLALRAIYALGHADVSLVTTLSKAAGIESDTRAPSSEEMARLVAEVNAKGDPARGERIFRRPNLNCARCHAVSGAGGGVGPELSSVGLSSPSEYVIYSILVPDQSIKEQYVTRVVATTDGQVYQGIVADKDDSRIVLREATGDLRTIPASDVEESREGGSLMPKGLANLLTRDEFLDLVRFVSELGKPGPYALHATPTIQRWRVMTPVPDDLAKDVPDAGAFVARVRDSDPSAWVAAYALSTGVIPVDEFSKLAGSEVIYARGEIDVTAAGPLTFTRGSGSGVSAWIDDAPAPGGEEFTATLAEGKHTLTLRIDGKAASSWAIKVEVKKGAGAEFVVVGGK